MSALSASKQKRLAAKAAKEASKNPSAASTPAGTNGRNTPNPDEDGDFLAPALSAIDLAKAKGGDRNSTGVLTSQPLSRDIKIESFSLSFHGRELISNTDIDLNFGRRYGLIGANGSGKSTLLECLAAREVPIPEHIDVGFLTFLDLSFSISLFLFHLHSVVQQPSDYFTVSATGMRTDRLGLCATIRCFDSTVSCAAQSLSPTGRQT